MGLLRGGEGGRNVFYEGAPHISVIETITSFSPKAGIDYKYINVTIMYTGLEKFHRK